MNPDQLKGLVLTIPDKFHHKQTTSHAFKNFIIDKFDGSTGEVLEVGCHMGHTTLILSELFSHVYCINHNPIDDNWLCKDRDNVTYEHMDAYKTEWKWDKWKNVEVVLIDCVHDYDHAKMDTAHALKLPKVHTIIYDDYGDKRFWGVKKAADEIAARLGGELTMFGLDISTEWLDLQDSEAALVEFKR